MLTRIGIALALHSLCSMTLPAFAGSAPKVYQGSVSECTAELAALGLCKPDALTRCVTVDASEGPASCRIVGRALLVEPETDFTKEVAESAQVSVREAGRKTVCFAFAKDQYFLWGFKNFTGFNGSCTPDGEKPKCDPLVEACDSYAPDAGTCEKTWPCFKVELKKKSFASCTADLEKSGACKKRDEGLYTGCLNYRNLSPQAMRCDLSLEASFHGARAPEKVVRRDEKLFPLQEQTICYDFGKPQTDFGQLLHLGLVCEPAASGLSPAAACDLATADCRDETARYLQVTR